MKKKQASSGGAWKRLQLLQAVARFTASKKSLETEGFCSSQLSAYMNPTSAPQISYHRDRALTQHTSVSWISPTIQLAGEGTHMSSVS